MRSIFLTPDEYRRMMAGRLKTCRKLSDLTQEDIAKQLGCSRSVISKMENGNLQEGTLLYAYCDSVMSPKNRDYFYDLIQVKPNKKGLIKDPFTKVGVLNLKRLPKYMRDLLGGGR